MNDAQRLKLLEAALMLDYRIVRHVKHFLFLGSTTLEVDLGGRGRFLYSSTEVSQVMASLMVTGLLYDGEERRSLNEEILEEMKRAV